MIHISHRIHLKGTKHVHMSALIALWAARAPQATRVRFLTQGPLPILFPSLHPMLSCIVLSNKAIKRPKYNLIKCTNALFCHPVTETSY